MFSFSRKKKEYILTPTQELLLALLCAQLWLKPVDDITLPSSIESWDELLNLGYKQTVICFIAAACLRHKDADCIPVEIREELKAVLEENKRIHEHHNRILIELITRFEEQGLHPILLKGQGIAQMYDCVEPEEKSLNSQLSTLNSQLRQCGDFDIYFRKDEYEKAEAFIKTIEDDNDEHIINYNHYETHYKGVTVELHKHTAWLPNPFANKRYQRWTDESLKTVTSIVIDRKDICIPNPIYDLISVFVHMWNHFEDKGISLRQVCDVLVLQHYFADNIEEKKLIECLKYFSFWTPWQIFCSVFVPYLSDSNDCQYQINESIRQRGYAMLNIMFTDGAFNFSKKKEYYSQLPFFKRKWAVHIDGHRSFMRIYPVTGSRIFWRYAAFKRSLVYRLIKMCAECEV